MGDHSQPPIADPPVPNGHLDDLIFGTDEDIDPVVPPAVRTAVPETARTSRRSALKIAVLATAAAVILMLAGGLIAYNSLKGDLTSTNHRVDRAVSAAADNKSVADKLSRQLQQNGIKPTATATATPTGATEGPTGPTGPAGPAPDFQQVVQAVQAYCTLNAGACSQGPTQVQVQAAVSLYCDSHGKCTGPPGVSATGQQGATGASGSAGQNGQNGENASDAQVAAAVADYCSQPGNCVGQTGASGQPGANGSDGASGTPGYPPGAIVVVIPGVLGDATETCTPPAGQAGPGAQPTYSCS